MVSVEKRIFEAEVVLALATMKAFIPKQDDNLPLINLYIGINCQHIRKNLEDEQRECLGYVTFGPNGFAISIA